MIVTEPQVGDVGLVSVGGFVGWLIRNMQRLNGTPAEFCHFEHSFLCTDATNGYGFEAQPGGAQFFNYTERYQPGDIVWVRVADLTDEQKTELVQKADAMKGVPYSFLEYFALLEHRVHMPLPGLKKYIADTDHQICSQIIDTLYTQLGYKLFDGRWPGYVTPADYRVTYGEGVCALPA